MASKESFGIVAAAQRARAWAPHLATAGQRLVLAALVVHMGSDSVSDPSIGTEDKPGQLVSFTGYSPRAIRRILTELTKLEVIAPLSDRSPGGRNKTTKWTIRPPETRTGESVLAAMKPGPGRPKPGLGSAETRTGESDTESSEISEQHNCETEGHDWVHIARSVARCRFCRESTNDKKTRHA